MISPIPYLKILKNLSGVWLCTIWPTMTIKGGTNKACAACKYQRRKCSKECPLSPYFPADQPKKFSNAHRLFGVSNIMRILNQVEPKQKDEAMKSIIFESDMRAQYPVTGCLGIIWNYNNQILNAMEELRYLKMRLAIYKEHFHCQYHLARQMSPSPVLDHPAQLGMPTSHDSFSSIYNHLQHNNNSEVGMFDGNGVYGSTYIESIQQPFNAMAAQSSNFMANHQELDIAADYDDIPFDAMVDDRQSFIECREACESSAESSFREAKHHIEHVSENELKSAAACFSLTSVKG